MLIQVVLCAYLLLAVIDLALWGVATSQGIVLLLATLNLCFFIFVLLHYSFYFQQAATQEGKRIVFTPVVFFFFSFALSFLIGSLLGADGLSANYLLGSVIIGLVLFSLIGSLFDLFAFRSTRVQSLIRGRIVILSIGRGVVYISQGKEISWGDMIKKSALFGQSGKQQQANRGTVITVSGDALPSGRTLEEIGSGADDGTANVPLGDEETAEITDNPQSKEPLTYRYLLPTLDRMQELDPTNAQPTFSLLSSTDPLYPAFQRAWGMNMIGTNINPDWQVGCGNLAVVLGIAQGWKVSADLPVIEAYRQKAGDEGMRGGCTKVDQVATQSDIPRL